MARPDVLEFPRDEVDLEHADAVVHEPDVGAGCIPPFVTGMRKWFRQQWRGLFSTAEQPDAIIAALAVKRFRGVVEPEFMGKHLHVGIDGAEQSMVVEPTFERLPQAEGRAVERQITN